VVVFSDGFWHSHFGADPELLGKSMTFDGKSATVIGILPATFNYPIVFPEPQIRFPRVFETTLVTPEQVHSGAGYLSLIARMRRGETLPRGAGRAGDEIAITNRNLEVTQMRQSLQVRQCRSRSRSWDLGDPRC
jgi:hypothetical protein